MTKTPEQILAEGVAAKDAMDPLVGKPQTVDDIRRKYELGEHRDTRFKKPKQYKEDVLDYPMLPCDVNALKLYAGDINIMTAGRVVLRLKSSKSRNWLLFVDGKLVKELRTARAMSFMDGFMASARFNK